MCKTHPDITIDPELKEIVAQADYAVVNFEAPVEGVVKAIPKSGPALRQSAESPRFLNDHGFNVILLANNHMMDMGREGCLNTIASFDKDTLTVGAGTLHDAFKAIILEKEGLKVGIVNAAHREFGTLGAEAEDVDYGVAWINHPALNREILRMRSECDFLIVAAHAGVEDLPVPLPEWRARYRELIDFGADAVIASHPHVPQGKEEYAGKRIYYSLGNFYFQSAHPGTPQWNMGIALEIEVEKGKNAKYKEFITRFSTNRIGIDKDTESRKYWESLNSLLADKKRYVECLDTELEKIWPEYQIYIMRGLSAMSLRSNFHVLLHAAYGFLKGGDLPLLINNFQCESHSWAIQRVLRNRIENDKKE